MAVPLGTTVHPAGLGVKRSNPSFRAFAFYLTPVHSDDISLQKAVKTLIGGGNSAEKDGENVTKWCCDPAFL